MEEAVRIIEQGQRDALALLDERAVLRRFRPPYIIHYVDRDGRVLMTFSGSKVTCDVDAFVESAPSEIVAEDGRGRKASVRLEVEARLPSA